MPAIPLRRKVKAALRRWMLSTAHGVPAESTERDLASSGPVPLRLMLPLLFPDVPPERRAALEAAARATLEREGIFDVTDLRKVLGGVDHQAFPSPVTIRFRPDDVFEVSMGAFGLVGDRADVSVSSVVAAGAYEPHVTATLQELCKPGMCVVDVGANIGFHTLALSGLVGSSGRVIAVEPNSENCRLILAALAGNKCTNVELLPLALDAKRGWAYFVTHLGSNGGLISTDSREYVEGVGTVVPTETLDDVVHDRVDLIKIDVEGAEGRVLRGAMRTLERWSPIVISEFSCEMLRRVSATDPAEYLQVFEDLKYELRVISRAQPGQLIATTATDLLASWSDEFRIEDLLFLPPS